MIVSNFEIRYSTYTEITTGYDMVVTNLSKKYYYFGLVVHTDVPSFHQLVYHDALRSGTDQDLLALVPAGQNRYRSKWPALIESEHTVRFRVFPVGLFSDRKTDVRALGHAELVIPTIYGGAGSDFEVQGDDPVPVLVHAYQHDFHKDTFARDYHPIALSTGMAENEIRPDQVTAAAFGGTSLGSLAGAMKTKSMEMDAALRDQDVALAQTLSVLSAADGDRANLRALNKLIAEAKLPFEVARKKKSTRPKRKKKS